MARRRAGLPASLAMGAVADNRARRQCTDMGKQCTCLSGVFVFVAWFSTSSVGISMRRFVDIISRRFVTLFSVSIFCILKHLR